MSEPPVVVVVGGWASPFVTRVCIALKLKGVEYEFLQEAVGKKSELLLRSNPVYKKMPVILHGGLPVCESLVILQYVDEAFPVPSILPPDPYRRAVHRFWAEYADAKLHTGLRTMRGMVGGDKADAAEQVSAALRQLEEALAECSGGKPYFGGDDVGFLDIVVGSYIGWFGAAERIAELPVLDEATPRLAAWASRFCAYEAVRDLMPDADRLVEFGEVLRAALAAAAANASSWP
uniref:Uncharacterized protein n=1 Tax=Avena sativa TaxID=4498 RepID=A0ACD5WWF8_AVESA